MPTIPSPLARLFSRSLLAFSPSPSRWLSLSLALSLFACTRTQSLGSAGDPDASAADVADVADDASAADVTAADVTDVDGQADRVVRDTGHDVPVDVPMPVDAPDDAADGPPDLCLDNGVTYHVGDVIPRGTASCPISCICIAAGVVGRCTGACPVDALPADASPVADGTSSCVNTFGQVSAGLCCSDTGDFPDTCAVGACSCSPASSHSVNTCVCPSGTCFLPGLGCVGPAGVCTVGDDQSCNDNIGLNAFHGQCVAGGRCICKLGPGHVAASGKCL